MARIEPASTINKRGVAYSTALFVLAFLVGDAAMVAVTGATKHFYRGPGLVQWLIAMPIIALGGYFLFGLPQIAAWALGSGQDVDQNDVRSRFAVRQLDIGGWLAFTAASLIGGPLAVGLYYGRRRDPRARKLTMLSAWLLAAVWSAVYLGLLTWIFD